MERGGWLWAYNCEVLVASPLDGLVKVVNPMGCGVYSSKAIYLGVKTTVHSVP